MKLPSAETYERELQFMPYRKSLQMVEDIVCADAPRNGKILDLMCGTGYLISNLALRRPDLSLRGLDINREYIAHAIENYSRIRLDRTWRVNFDPDDILTWQPQPRDAQFDVVLCTGAVHHIPYDRQEKAIEQIAKATKPRGFAIISDCYIDDFLTEQERQLAAAKLGYEYLGATIRNGAPANVVAATADILVNDVTGQEFKTSYRQRLPIFQKHFGQVKTMKTWPNRQIGGYGDYVTILRK